jgi:uncharacterized membrane protein
LKIEVEVQNFGQVASKNASVKIWMPLDDQQQEVASANVPPLKPFEKTVVKLHTSARVVKGRKYSVTVRTECEGQKPEILTREIAVEGADK